MKLFFTKKSFIQKMIICIVLVLLVNFTLAPTFSQASDLGSDLGNIFFNILLRCGDGIVWLVQKVVYGMDNSIITIDRTTNWKTVAGYICAGLATAGIITGIIASGPVGWIAAGVGAAGVAGSIGSFISASKDEIKTIDKRWNTSYIIFTNI